MKTETKTWYAVYTRPRWEKKVARLLELHQIEAYCPVTSSERNWGKRRTVVQEPLFRPYVFVRVTEKMKWRVLEVSGILNYVTWLGKPAAIKDYEIESVKAFVVQYGQVHVEAVALRPAMQVMITGGAFSDYVGAVQEVRENQVQVVIDSLGIKLVATVPGTKLKVVAAAPKVAKAGA